MNLNHTADPQTEQPPIMNTKTDLAKILAVLGSVGGGVAWTVSNWTNLEPVLHSTPFVFLLLAAMFGTGAASAYFVQVLPMRRQMTSLNKNVGELTGEVLELRETLAAVETELKLYREGRVLPEGD